jgi:hypothetical protein
MTTAIVQGIINRYLQKWLKNVTTEHAALTTGDDAPPPAGQSSGVPHSAEFALRVGLCLLQVKPFSRMWNCGSTCCRRSSVCLSSLRAGALPPRSPSRGARGNAAPPAF